MDEEGKRMPVTACDPKTRHVTDSCNKQTCPRWKTSEWTKVRNTDYQCNLFIVVKNQHINYMVFRPYFILLFPWVRLGCTKLPVQLRTNLTQLKEVLPSVFFNKCNFIIFSVQLYAVAEQWNAKFNVLAMKNESYQIKNAKNRSRDNINHVWIPTVHQYERLQQVTTFLYNWKMEIGNCVVIDYASTDIAFRNGSIKNLYDI